MRLMYMYCMRLSRSLHALQVTTGTSCTAVACTQYPEQQHPEQYLNPEHPELTCLPVQRCPCEQNRGM